jgi:hypothetical protein
VIAMACVKQMLGFRLIFFAIMVLTVLSQGAVARDVSQAGGNLLLTPAHGGGEGWGKTKCASCHALFRLHDTVPKIKKLVNQKKFKSCSGCHGKNGTSVKQQCVLCHNNKDMPGIPRRTGKHRHDFSLLKTRPTTNEQCIACHAASDMNGRFELDRDLTMIEDSGGFKEPYPNISEFCIRCHNDNNPHKKYPIVNAGRRDQAIKSENHYRFIDKHGELNGSGEGIYTGLRSENYSYKSIVECVDCHTMHGTTNESNLIIDDSRKAKFFSDQQSRRKPEHFKVKVLDDKSFIDNPDEDGPPQLVDEINCAEQLPVKAGNYSQLCVLCHNMQNRPEESRLSQQDLEFMGGHCATGNGLSGVHFNEGTNCVTCHYHGRPGISGL